LAERRLATGRSFAISNEVNWIDLDQYRNGASCAGRLWIEDVCCAETQFSALVSLRVLVQQESQVCGWFMSGADRE
jgi:hypothetical protein